jgi:hypothetical protein
LNRLLEQPYQRRGRQRLPTCRRSQAAGAAKMKNDFRVAIRYYFEAREEFAEVLPIIPKALDGIA